MPRIFISYSRADASFARDLATALSNLGVEVWLDVDDIPAGMNWGTAIQEGLRVCDAMILVISPDSMASRNVEVEWQYYWDRSKPIFPVLLHNAEVHFQLSRLQYINFSNQKFDIALKQLIGELRRGGIPIAEGEISSLNLPTQEALAIREGSPNPLSRLARSGFLIAGVVLMILLVVGIDFMINQFSAITPTATPTIAPTTAVVLLDTASPTGVGTPFLASASQTVPPSETLSPTLTPTKTTDPTDPPTPTLTLTLVPTDTPTPNATQRESTLQAVMAGLQIEQESTRTAEAVMTASALTATANSWTDTPTPDDRATAAARLARTAEQVMRDATATADVWTDTPTPTNTYTPSKTNTPTPTKTYTPVGSGTQEGDFTLSVNEESIRPIVYSQIIRSELSTDEPYQDFLFTGEAGDNVLINERSTQFDSYLRLLDMNGTTLIENDDSGGTLNAQIVPYVLPATGTYTIRATSQTGTSSGSFTLSLTKVES